MAALHGARDGTPKHLFPTMPEIVGRDRAAGWKFALSIAQLTIGRPSTAGS
jgi:hypothetical protein